MSNSARVHIGKVTYKGTNVSMLRSRVPPGPAQGTTGAFIETLLHIIERARRGEVVGYAMVYDVINSDGSQSGLECADVRNMDDSERITLLGSIRTMEHNFMRRSGLLED